MQRTEVAFEEQTARHGWTYKHKSSPASHVMDHILLKCFVGKRGFQGKPACTIALEIKYDVCN